MCSLSVRSLLTHHAVSLISFIGALVSVADDRTQVQFPTYTLNFEFHLQPTWVELFGASLSVWATQPPPHPAPIHVGPFTFTPRTLAERERGAREGGWRQSSVFFPRKCVSEWEGNLTAQCESWWVSFCVLDSAESLQYERSIDR